MLEEEKKSAFSSLPPRLQAAFFEHAERAARKTLAEVISERSKVSSIGGMLRFREIPAVLGRDIRVGVVDGSSSPAFSDRLGYRIGIYTACYMVFEGPHIVSDKDDESMEGGYLMASQVGNVLQTRKILSLLMTAKERELALRCMRKFDVDLIMIDGSFYGFRTRCSEVKKVNLESMDVENFRRGWELINYVLDLTRKLVKSGKAVSVIKRLRTCAIDGWILSRRWSVGDLLNRNDRSILRTLLPFGRYFDYRDLLGEEASYLHYSSLVSWYGELVGAGIVMPGDPENSRRRALEYVHRKLRTQIRTDLCPPDMEAPRAERMGEELIREIAGRPRFHVRLSPYTAPICLELGDGVDPDVVLSYSFKNANMATGIPFPLDLVDEVISVDKRLAKEFADEVEARLLLDPSISAEEVEARLEPLNPQKEE